jgi:hypothetical protein
MKPSGSPGGFSPCRPATVTIHRRPSSGMSNAPRLLRSGRGTQNTAFQSVGASSGMAKTAVAYSRSTPIVVCSGNGRPIEIGREVLVRAAVSRAAHPGDGVPAGPGDELPDPTARLDLHVGQGAHAPAHDRLQLGAGQRVGVEAEVALGEGIVARPLRPQIEAHPQGHGAHRHEVRGEADEELPERLLAPGQERVHVLALGHPDPVGRLVGERVTLQHEHALEPIGQHAGRGEPAHAGADDDGPFAYRTRHHLPSIRTPIIR